MGFTFKKELRNTGLYAVAHPHSNVDIKLRGQVVGWIDCPSVFGHTGWHIWLRVKDEDSTCSWSNKRIKGSWETEQEARDFLKQNFDSIVSKFALSPEPKEPPHER